MQFFNTDTFLDPTSQKPSFVRKSLAWMLLFAAGLILLGVLMFGLVKLDVAKEISAYILKVVAAITGFATIAYGAMQGAKGYAQGQAAKAPQSTTVITDPPPWSDPKKVADLLSKASPPDAATAKTTTATDTSTKAGGAQ